MDIKVANYLTEKEIKQICIEELRETLQFDEPGIKRLVRDAAYGMVWKKVDEVFDTSIEELLRDKVIEIVNDLTEFSIFKKPSMWSREPNNAYKFLQSCIEDEFDNVKKIVSENIPQLTLAMLKQGMHESIQTAIQELYQKI